MRIRIWDLPTRLFHWTLVALVGAAWATAEVGGNAMAWHMRIGFVIAGLLAFRLAWGVIGSTHARFASFVRGPRAVLAYLAALFSGTASRSAGHNPAGGWSVLAMLALLVLQVATGLFASDDIYEGPLYKYVGNRLGHLLTEFHEENFELLLPLIGLHVTAIVFYRYVKGENLIRAMITGTKDGRDEDAARGGGILAFLIAAGLGAAAGWLVANL